MNLYKKKSPALLHLITLTHIGIVDIASFLIKHKLQEKKDVICHTQGHMSSS